MELLIPIELVILGAFPIAIFLVVWLTYYIDPYFDKWLNKKFKKQ